MRRWIRWRWRCWRTRHFVYLAYVEWCRFPCSRTHDVWLDWNKYLNRMVVMGPQWHS